MTQDDTVEQEALDGAALFDSIPGAWERVLEGEEDARMGRCVALEDL